MQTTLWQVQASGPYISFGARRRRKLDSQACNQPYMDRFWCPTRGWFARKPCPFVNRQECDRFTRMCGSL
ncbi:MAG: hypothetical protein D6E12_03935 [Desulfovibrio sp.]|nr:MAG: hypothetical protein D6E12_03935 [Desulfovibrio sp.]